MSVGAQIDPERIVVAGDWHGSTGRALEVVRQTADEGARIVLHTGDLGVLPTPDGVAFVDALEAALDEAGVELWFVDGNHDDHHALRTAPRQPDGTALIRKHIRYLPRGHRWQWHGQSWLALGGAHSIDPGQYVAGVEWWPEEVVADADVEAATAGGHVDNLITHDAPLGVDVPGYVGNPHGWSAADLAAVGRNRAAVRAVVDAVRPARLYHGHYHVRYTTALSGSDYRTQVIGLADDQSPLTDNLLTLDFGDSPVA